MTTDENYSDCCETKRKCFRRYHSNPAMKFECNKRDIKKCKFYFESSIEVKWTLFNSFFGPFRVCLAKGFEKIKDDLESLVN